MNKPIEISAYTITSVIGAAVSYGICYLVFFHDQQNGSWLRMVPSSSYFSYFLMNFFTADTARYIAMLAGLVSLHFCWNFRLFLGAKLVQQYLKKTR